jgi:hypothetical protein
MPEPTTPALAIGRAVHKVADALLRAKGAARQGGRPCDVTADDVSDLAQSLTAESLREIDAPDSADPEIQEERAADAAELCNQVDAMCQLWWRQAAPSIEPAAIELTVSGKIAGIAVTGIIDILDVSGAVIDLKTASKKPQGISASHYLQLVTYAMLADPAALPARNPTADFQATRGSTQPARLDTLTKTRAPGYYSHSLTIDDDACRYAESIYPMVAEAIGDGLYLPRRSSNLCSRRHCPYWQTCEAEYGGAVRP